MEQYWPSMLIVFLEMICAHLVPFNSKINTHLKLKVVLDWAPVDLTRQACVCVIVIRTHASLKYTPSKRVFVKKISPTIYNLELSFTHSFYPRVCSSSLRM